MSDYLAHSRRDGHREQTYEEHVLGVMRRAGEHAEAMGRYATKTAESMNSIVSRAAELHDLGKLDLRNQAVLHQSNGRQRLPVNHVDAGTARLLEEDELFAALAVYSHHRGLPDLQDETEREDDMFRDPSICAEVDRALPKLYGLHRQLITASRRLPSCSYDGTASVFCRMMLSCLADADHSDTAAAYGNDAEDVAIPELRAEERLKRLDAYVNGLQGSDERSKLRQAMYVQCRDTRICGGFVACDSPVGSGKTTAVMAHLLSEAAHRKARRIFVVLPYTSIIDQAVEVYRKHLALPGEDPEAVVAAVHSKADYQDEQVLHLSARWQAPIVVTTAVSFFETLASNRPSALRRLHELPGSIIFIDEAHAALPVKLLQLAWHWMNVLADEWQCYWVLASGSLVRFWTMPEIVQHPSEIPDLVEPELRDRLMSYEVQRVSHRHIELPVSRDALVERVLSSPGPRLLIMNTVPNAAILARDLCSRGGRNSVEHLSTALTPFDREHTIRRIRDRLADPADCDWTLVATSCVEAGMDFSFRTGFREVASLLSLLQAAGRVNRHGSTAEAEIWSFTLQDDSLLTVNPQLRDAGKVLRHYFAENAMISPELSTRSMTQELNSNDSTWQDISRLFDSEMCGQFVEVAERFRVIDSDTVTAVIGTEYVERVRSGDITWQELQKHSVAVPKDKTEQWKLELVKDDIYAWTLHYDGFLGYMAGVLPRL